ncbi:MAG TPA: transposase [Gaiellaceae bacterium]|jgi:REP element-mobilizing transposase RayT|nr:transposase [Gaiellaceae bacterium]
MGRPLRIIAANGVYHVFPRGNNKEQIFWDDRDYRTCLAILEVVVARHNLVLLSYCLMPNHFHLLVRVPEANLSAAMQYLNGGYSRATNVRRGRVRHLFQNRFEAVHVQTDAHLHVAFRYIDLNPVEAKLCRRPEDHRWGSHRAIAGLAMPPPFLALRAALAFFHSDPKRARAAYRALVRHELVTVSDTVTEV